MKYLEKEDQRLRRAMSELTLDKLILQEAPASGAAALHLRPDMAAMALIH